MSGDERVRHCERCDLNVFNLSEMNRSDAEDLIRKSEGRMCIRYHARADGTMITSDCPVGRGLVRRRLRRIAACVVGAFGALIGTGFAMSGGVGLRRGAQMRSVKAFAAICDRISPRQTLTVMGDMIWVPPNTPSLPTSNCSGPSNNQGESGRAILGKLSAPDEK